MIKTWIFTANCIASILLGFWLIHPFWSNQFVVYCAYPIIFLTFCIFIYSLLKQYRCNCNFQFIKKTPIGPILTIIGCSIFLFLHEPFGFKIVMDELILLGTSMMMHFEGVALVPGAAHEITGSFRLLDGYLDKRPFFHPFLLSLLHDIIGYRPENSFILNILLTPILLSLTYLFGRKISDQNSGILGVLLITGIPLLSQNATGGGFEILNLVMILSCMIFGLRYLEKLDDDSLTTFCFAGILLAQTRYESVLYILSVTIVVLLGWAKAKRVILSWPAAISPILLLNYPLQRNAVKNNELFWQLPDGVQNPFSLDFFPDQIVHAYNYFFQIGQSQSNSLLVSILGITALIIFLIYSYSTIIIPFYSKLKSEAKTLHSDDGYDNSRNAPLILLLFLKISILLFILLMCYHWGELDDPVVSRISLPMMLMSIFTTIYCIKKYPKIILPLSIILFGGISVLHLISINAFESLQLDRSSINLFLILLTISIGLLYLNRTQTDPLPWLIGLTIVFILFCTTPIVANHRYAQGYTPAKQVTIMRNFFKKYPQRDIYFSSKSGLPAITHQISSAPIKKILLYPNTISKHLVHKNFSGIFVFQLVDVDPDTGELVVVDDYKLSPEIHYETVYEQRLVPLQLARIIQITSIDLSAMEIKSKKL